MGAIFGWFKNLLILSHSDFIRFGPVDKTVHMY